jgi:hypothetical protein
MAPGRISKPQIGFTFFSTSVLVHIKCIYPEQYCEIIKVDTVYFKRRESRNIISENKLTVQLALTTQNTSTKFNSRT